MARVTSAEEALPQLEFRHTTVGRQAFVKGRSLAVWEVVVIARAYDMDVGRTAEHLEWSQELVQAALSYAEANAAEIRALVNDFDAVGTEDLRRVLPGLREIRL